MEREKATRILDGKNSGVWEEIMELFLDRDGEVYGAVLAFPRDGALPAEYSLPAGIPTS